MPPKPHLRLVSSVPRKNQPVPAVASSRNYQAEQRDYRVVPAFAALLFILVLVGAGFALTLKLRDMAKLQDCLLQGRSNCAPIDRSGQ